MLAGMIPNEQSLRWRLYRWLSRLFVLLFAVVSCFEIFPSVFAAAHSFEDHVGEVIQRYCFECHSSEKQKGDIDLEVMLTPGQFARFFKEWEIVVEQLQAGKQDWLFEALAYLDQRQLCQRQLDLDSGVSTLSTQDSHHPLQINEHQLQQSLGPRMRMLLVGAGQLAQVLSSLALAMDFDVLVTDPREDAIAQWQGPDVPLLHGLPDDIIATQAFDRQSVIITLTHDPRIDDMALMEALETDAWYVGALGSVRTTEQRLQRLHELGVADSAIARLHAPVGLDIGSKTPWEIAVAIMAEITQLQRRP